MSKERPTEPQDEAVGVRERILDAAIATLREKGVRALSQVQVARRAGVRQSHLTYYFPKRQDLLEAVAERVAGAMAEGVRGTLAVAEGKGPASTLQRLAGAIAEQGHMRMFIAVIVEADGDPEVRAILVRHTRRLEAALAEALGSETPDGEAPGREDAAVRARLVLASLWGLGLYEFLTGAPFGPEGAGPPPWFLARLSGDGSGRKRR